MFQNNEKQQGALLYLISQLGIVRYDRLCDLVFLASSKDLLKYQFDYQSGRILSSVELRKDLSELIRKTLVVEGLEKINEDFDESTHVYRLTDYGRSMVHKIRNKGGYRLRELETFLSKYRDMPPERLEKAVMETIRG